MAHEFDLQNNKLAIDLLKGSRAIGEMRKEILELVQMMEALVHKALARRCAAWSTNFAVTRGGCRWSVSASIGNMNRSLDYFKVEAWTDPGSLVFAYPKANDYSFPATEVLVVHENLDMLVQALRKDVPGLSQEFQPFQRAAERTLTREEYLAKKEELIARYSCP